METVVGPLRGNMTESQASHCKSLERLATDTQRQLGQYVEIIKADESQTEEGKAMTVAVHTALANFHSMQGKQDLLTPSQNEDGAWSILYWTHKEWQDVDDQVRRARMVLIDSCVRTLEWVGEPAVSIVGQQEEYNNISENVNSAIISIKTREVECQQMQMAAGDLEQLQERDKHKAAVHAAETNAQLAVCAYQERSAMLKDLGIGVAVFTNSTDAEELAKLEHHAKLAKQQVQASMKQLSQHAEQVMQDKRERATRWATLRASMLLADTGLEKASEELCLYLSNQSVQRYLEFGQRAQDATVGVAKLTKVQQSVLKYHFQSDWLNNANEADNTAEVEPLDFVSVKEEGALNADRMQRNIFFTCEYY
jgi:citrate synthase